MADGASNAAQIVVRRVRTWRVADLFCGAGGFSTGARRALHELGLAMSLVAANHWPTAIATHLRNHPDAAHHCVDLEVARPRELVPGNIQDGVAGFGKSPHEAMHNFNVNWWKKLP